MKDKNNRNYSIKIEGKMTRLNYRGTTGVYPTKQFNSIPIEEVLDRADVEIMKVFNKHRNKLSQKP